jgi:chromosome segregation ATPase
MSEKRESEQAPRRKDERLREIQALTGVPVTTLASLGVRFDARDIEIVADLCRKAHDTHVHQETLRQLAQVTAERDQLQSSLEERRRQVELLAYELRKWQTGEHLDIRLVAERDVLKTEVSRLQSRLDDTGRRQTAFNQALDDRDRAIASARVAAHLAEKERDALKRRVEELEREVRSLQTYDRESLL